MPQIIIDPGMENQLREFSGPVEFVGRSGKIVGVFSPTTDKGPPPTISEKEVERRIAGGGGRTLDKILVDLEKRQ